MSIRFIRLLAAYALLMFYSIPVTAQSEGQSEFTVELKSEEAFLGPNYVGILEDYRTHQRVGTTDLSADDTFRFRGVPKGDYQLTITDRKGAVILQTMVLVSPAIAVATVQLPKRKEQRPPSGPVSLAELQHSPARKAVSAMVQAQRFSEAGDFRRAAEELEKAVRISPDYPAAHVNLAVEYIRLEQYERAIEVIGRANQWMKPDAMQLCNLAYAQMKLQRIDAAAEAARAALRLDAHYPQAHYILGALLARDPQTVGEALSHLEQAAKTLPSAGSMLEAVRKDRRTLKGD